MRHIYKKLAFGIAIIGVILGMAPAIVAAGPFLTAVGGTGTSTPSGIMYGDNGATNHLNTLVIGTNLTLSGGTLSATGGGSSFGYPFPGNATSTQLNFLGGASTTLLSVFRTAYFGGTGTTTINSTGDLFVAGSTTVQNMTFVNATGTNATTTSFAITNAASALLITNSGGSIGKYGGSSNPCTNQVPTTISALGATGGCVSINNAWWSGTQLSVANGGTGVTSVGTNMVLSSNAAGNIVPTSTPSIAAFSATSTNATSSIGAAIWFTPDPNIGRPMYIGTSTSATPIYGLVQGGIDFEYNFNGNTGWNVVNDNAGTCASEGYWADGNIPALNSNYAFFGFLNVGWTGSGCAMGNGLERPLDTVLTNPTGGLDIEMASTTQVKMQVYGKNGVKVFSVTNDTGIASTTGLVVSNSGGTAGCATFAVDGTVSNTHIACGTGGGTPGGANTQIQFNDGGSFGGSSLLDFWKGGGWMTIGTSTASSSVLTVGSSSAPQIALSDNLSNIWTMRSAGGNIYFATSTATATSAPQFTIDPNGNVILGSLSGVSNKLLRSSTGGAGAITTYAGTSCAGGTAVQVLDSGGFASTCISVGGAAGAQSSTTVAFVIYPIDQTSNPSQYFMYNASSTAVTQSANFQTLLKNAYSSIGAGGSYSGTSKGNGPGGAIFLTQGTFYTNATTTCNGNEQFSTNNAPRCELYGAGQEATKVVVVGGADFLNFDHGAIPSVHDMSIYTTGFEKAIVATSSNPNIRSIWQFDFHNLDIESTTTFATTTAFFLGNVLRGQIYNIETYGQNNSFWLYAEGNFNVGGLTITRSFLDFSSAATSTAFKFTQLSTGFVNEVEGYYNEAIGRTTGATYIDSTGLAFSHFNDSSAEQMDVMVDGKVGTISNQFDFAYSINRNGGANIRGCRFWGGSYDNQCNFQNGNNDTSAAIIDDMNSNTDFPNRISGSVTQSGGTGSASSTAVANYQIINFHGSGTFDANFKPDTDWTGYQIWSKVIAKSYKAFLSGSNAAAGLYVDINTSIATNVGLFINDETNFAHAGDLIRLVLKNASDSANALDIQNLGTGASINATSSRGTDFIVQGGKSGFGTTTPFGFFSLNPNAVGTAPYFVIGSSSVTNFLVKASTIANILVGTTTAVTAPTNVVAQLENPPTGLGTFASSTLVVGDPSTTTSRSQIEMNSSSGAPVCIDVRGTALTVTAGACP